MWRLAFALSLCTALSAASLSASAQVLAPGEIVVTVTDAATKAPIDTAIVILLGGDHPESSLSGPDGKVTFPDVQVGSYAVEVKRDGYKTYDVADVEVRDNQRVRVDVALASTDRLTVIAAVVAKASSMVTSSEIGADSSERKVSSSLKDALGKLAGVTLDDTTYGSSSAFGISLLDHDASQTGYAINGIRIAGGADASSPLFSGASVSFAPTAGSIGGTINLQTLRPTKYWTYDLSNTIGNFGASTQSISVTGTKGHLALAVQHALTSRDGFLSGRTYEDQSGLTYLHDAANTGLGDVIRGTYKFNQRISLNGFFLSEKSHYSTICSGFTTLLPCGSGPGGRNANTNNYAAFGGAALVGNLQLYGNISSSFGKYGQDYPSRTLGGVVSPYFFSSAYSGFNAYLGANLTAKRHEIDFVTFGDSFLTVSNSTYNGVPVTFPQPRQRSIVANLSSHVEANAGLALTHSISFEDTTGSGRSLVAEESVDWKPTKNDVVNGNVSIGNAGSYYSSSSIISDPFAAQYDCYNGSVITSGPSDPAAPASSSSYGLSWVHSFIGGNVKIQANRQSARGQSVGAFVPIAAEPGSIFPGGLPAYLTALQAVWSSAGICGVIPFQPDRAYVSDEITGLPQQTQSILASTHFQLGKNVLTLLNYGVTSAYLSALDPRLAAPNSFYAVGRQLPNRPLHSGGLTIDGTLAHANLEWLANAQFIGVNNGGNLPAYTLYTAGLVFHARVGTMTLLETNLFGSHAGLFQTYQGVNPMPLVGGGTFAFASSSAPPRQWFFTWRIPWSQRIPPPPKPAASPAPLPKPSPSPSAKP